MKRPEPWGYNYGNNYFNNGTRIPRKISVEIIDPWNQTAILLNETIIGVAPDGGIWPDKTYYTFKPLNGSRDLDGHIPQDYAGYTAGIQTGTYFVRIWINGYIQPSVLNLLALSRGCMVVFTQNEQSRGITIVLEKSGILKVTAHFINSIQGPLRETAISFNGTLTVDAYDVNGIRFATNSTLVGSGNRTASVELTGFLTSGRNYAKTRIGTSADYALLDYEPPSRNIRDHSYFQDIQQFLLLRRKRRPNRQPSSGSLHSFRWYICIPQLPSEC